MTPRTPLAELHAHLGTSISPVVLWRIAHDLGLKLPKDDFNDFRDYITLREDRRMTLDEYLHDIYHPVLDQLSGGTYAVEQATYFTIAGGYHSQHITTMELRNNPMRHNNNAQYDLDHITMAMLRGMERALLENKQLSAGLIFCMGRYMSKEQNSIILEKAIKYHHRGIVGIDVADGTSKDFKLRDYESLFDSAHRAGLGVTVHSGETATTDDMWEVLEYARPQRIGHGIRAYKDTALMRELATRGIVLEICPLSNLMTKAVKDIAELKKILHTFIANGVKFCINTDWPEVLENGHLRKQLEWLQQKDILSAAEIQECIATAFSATFVPAPGNLEAYLL